MSDISKELPGEQDDPVLMTIQNSKKPEQTLYLVFQPLNAHFVTQGLKRLFGLKEIWIESSDVLNSMQDIAQLLSFLLETMSAAQDLNLPYHYENEFEHEGVRYTLYEKGDHRLLKRAGAPPF